MLTEDKYLQLVLDSDVLKIWFLLLSRTFLKDFGSQFISGKFVKTVNEMLLKHKSVEIIKKWIKA